MAGLTALLDRLIAAGSVPRKLHAKYGEDIFRRKLPPGHGREGLDRDDIALMWPQLRFGVDRDGNLVRVTYPAGIGEFAAIGSDPQLNILRGGDGDVKRVFPGSYAIDAMSARDKRGVGAFDDMMAATYGYQKGRGKWNATDSLTDRNQVAKPGFLASQEIRGNKPFARLHSDFLKYGMRYDRDGENFYNSLFNRDIGNADWVRTLRDADKQWQELSPEARIGALSKQSAGALKYAAGAAAPREYVAARWPVDAPAFKDTLSPLLEQTTVDRGPLSPQRYMGRTFSIGPTTSKRMQYDDWVQRAIQEGMSADDIVNMTPPEFAKGLYRRRGGLAHLA